MPLVQNGAVTSLGSVRTFYADEGWGVIDGPDVPGGCWVHFSAIAADGYRALAPGQRVRFRAEAADQDGFRFRAVKVWTGDAEPPDRPRQTGGSAAYHSSLTLTFDATVAAGYADFAVREARGVSPAYERLALAVSRDDEVLALLGALPPGKRQPNLLFGVVRLLGGPVEDPAAFHAYAVAHWPAIEAAMRSRATQTNEAGRCAVLLPVLAALPQPLALLEVGASAGLCLYPDRYGYRYGGHVVGAGEPVLDCAATGVDLPAAVPEVVWRAGLDLNPLDVTDPGDLAWLDALIWPEHTHRRARLRAAAAVAAAEPPLLVRGDLVDDLPALAARAPAGATLVVFHSSVLHYVAAARRRAFVDVVRGLPGHWIANEGPAVLPYDGLPEPPDEALHNVLALDGRPLAWTRGHGQAMTWFG